MKLFGSFFAFAIVAQIVCYGAIIWLVYEGWIYLRHVLTANGVKGL